MKRLLLISLLFLVGCVKEELAENLINVYNESAIIAFKYNRQAWENLCEAYPFCNGQKITDKQMLAMKNLNFDKAVLFVGSDFVNKKCDEFTEFQ